MAALEEDLLDLPAHWGERGQAGVPVLREDQVELPKLEVLEELASLEEDRRMEAAWRSRGWACQSLLEEEVGEARLGSQEVLLDHSLLLRC